MAASSYILRRPYDMILVLLFTYYLWSCVFIERHYCEAPLDANSENSLLRATFEYSEKYNPLFLQRPEWLRVATCISAYVLSVGYILGGITFLLGLNEMRVPLLMFVSFKIYAITIYYYMEFFGDLPVPNIPMFLAADGPYLLGIIFMLFRLRSPQPFAVADRPKKH